MSIVEIIVVYVVVVIEMARVVTEGSLGVGCSVVDGESSWERTQTL